MGQPRPLEQHIHAASTRGTSRQSAPHRDPGVGQAGDEGGGGRGARARARGCAGSATRTPFLLLLQRFPRVGSHGGDAGRPHSPSHRLRPRVQAAAQGAAGGGDRVRERGRHPRRVQGCAVGESDQILQTVVGGGWGWGGGGGRRSGDGSGWRWRGRCRRGRRGRRRGCRRRLAKPPPLGAARVAQRAGTIGPRPPLRRLRRRARDAAPRRRARLLRRRARVRARPARRRGRAAAPILGRKLQAARVAQGGGPSRAAPPLGGGGGAALSAAAERGGWRRRRRGGRQWRAAARLLFGWRLPCDAAAFGTAKGGRQHAGRVRDSGRHRGRHLRQP